MRWLMDHSSSEIDLRVLAEQVVRARGFDPQFPPGVQQQVAQIEAHPPSATTDGRVRDLRSLLWSSIDNDDSKDLDQIEYAEDLGNGRTRVLVAIADVDIFATRNSAIDAHAARETT